MPRFTPLNLDKMQAEIFKLLREKHQQQQSSNGEVTERQLVNFYAQLDPACKNQLLAGLLHCDIFKQRDFLTTNSYALSDLKKAVTNRFGRWNNPINKQLKQQAFEFFEACVKKLFSDCQSKWVPGTNSNSTNHGDQRVNYTLKQMFDDARVATFKNLQEKNNIITKAHFGQKMRNGMLKILRQVVLQCNTSFDKLACQFSYYSFNPLKIEGLKESKVMEIVSVYTVIAYNYQSSLRMRQEASKTRDNARLQKSVTSSQQNIVKPKTYQEFEQQYQEDVFDTGELVVSVKDSGLTKLFANFMEKPTVLIIPACEQKQNQPIGQLQEHCCEQQEGSESNLSMVIISEAQNWPAH